MKSNCVNLQKRCDNKKPTRIRDEKIMLLSNELNSLWLPTCSHKADSGSPSVEDSQSIIQFVPRAREIKALGCFLLLRALKENFTIKSANVYLCQARCYPVKGLFFNSRHCISEAGKKRRKLVVTGSFSCTAHKFASTFVTHRSTVIFLKVSQVFFFTNYEILCKPLSLQLAPRPSNQKSCFLTKKHQLKILK